MSNNGSGRRLPSNTGPPRIGRIGQWGGSDERSNSPGQNSGGGPRIHGFSSLNQGSGGGGGGGGGASMPPFGGSGFATGSGDGEGNDEDDDEDRQNFYAGGERSALSVQNPDRPSNFPGGEILRSILQKARNAGGAIEENALSEQSSAFRGSGYTLGSDDQPSQFVPDPNATERDESGLERAIRHVTFWRDGFTIESGPLMRYDNPEHAATLAAINAGQAPPEVLNVVYGQPVELRVERKMQEEYPGPSAMPMSAFGGAGNRLGAPTPCPSTPSPAAASTSSSAVPTGSRVDYVDSIQTKFNVDLTQETYRIRLRLADGHMMSTRVNPTHTIGDLRSLFQASRPDPRPFVIATANRILDDESMTCKDANINMSVLWQKFET